MARGRMISHMVATDKRFNALSTEAALVFLMTVPHLDRDGLLLADAPVLAGQVCPRREELRPKMQSIIDEWVRQGLVIAFESEDGTVLFFTGFAKNQAGMRYEREPKSTLPVPPGYIRTVTGLEPLDTLPVAPKAPPTNGSAPPPDGKLPTNVRQPADTLPSERTRAEVEVEVEEKRRGDRAREPYRAQPNTGEYLPGVPLPRQRQAKCNADHIGRQRDKLGLSARQLTTLTDSVLERMNATEIAALDTDIGNDELKQAQETALALAGLGHKTPEKIGAVFDTWYTHDFRGEKGDPPTYKQIVGHAKDMPTKVAARQGQASKVSSADPALLQARARQAREKIRTAELTNMPVNPQWQIDIDAARGNMQ